MPLDLETSISFDDSIYTFMRISSYKKETTDLKYHNNIFRSINLKKDNDGMDLY